MNATRELIANYLRAWNETDPLRRRVLIDAVQGMFPGHVFRLAGDVDAHHDVARFHWHLVAPGADEPLVIGFDVAELDEGRIRRVHGFLDKVPMAA